MCTPRHEPLARALTPALTCSAAVVAEAASMFACGRAAESLTPVARIAVVPALWLAERCWERRMGRAGL